jgi:hypothetical protein
LPLHGAGGAAFNQAPNIVLWTAQGKMSIAGAADQQDRWCQAHEEYLLELAAVCRRMAQAYHVVHHTYLTRQKRVRVPIIAVSSLSGMLSFGTEVFPFPWHKYVNIVVGLAGLLVALVGSIESFLRMSETISGSATTALNLEKLAESICLELSMPVAQRHAEGVAFTRSSYSQFEKHMETAPNVLKKVVFLRPPWMLQQQHGGDMDQTRRRHTQDVQDLLPMLPPEELAAYRRRSLAIERPFPREDALQSPAMPAVAEVTLPGTVEQSETPTALHATEAASGGMASLHHIVQQWRTRTAVSGDVESPVAFH